MRFLALILALCAAMPATAHEFFLSGLQIIHPSLPATPVNANSAAVYMALSNEGDQDERLLGIETPFGMVRFVQPVTDAEGNIRMQERAWIDIPAGEIVLLARGELRGSLANVNRPLMEGGELTGTMIFEKRGRFDMFFMIDPVETETEHDPVSEIQRAAPPIDRAAAVSDIAASLRHALGSPDAVIAPVVLSENIAIAGWSLGNIGARAFLRRGADGWNVELWSNASLLQPATLTSLGVSRRQGDPLRAEMRAQEAALGPAYSRRFDAFPGTAYPTHSQP
ncbi:copper uptake system-associated protein [Celeribacter halophilus]|uniref:Copper(I)-binding protein n=1 Tax=Celeribacter halophilus TaxID=576117 RepID=A0A1I3T1F1_9RHOB|nr:copper uptake system-associated protein [Celeribacter halophilus]PZX11960.1 copper(I)-binding protein [Celeribacter halophilus]SFJ64938.1 Copper(I)-binding protein [Celeribacter halophilus]